MTIQFLYKYLPEFIYMHRRKLNLSQVEFAKNIGLTGRSGAQFLSNVENGRCTLPIQYWHKMAKFLDIPVEYIKDQYMKDEEEKIKHFLSK